MTSFLTMLMIEEIHPVSEDMRPEIQPVCRCAICRTFVPKFGCVSGTVSLTYYSRLNWTKPFCHKFLIFCDAFTPFVAQKAQNYLPHTDNENDTAVIANLSDTR